MNRDRALAIVASTGMILTWLATAASPRPEPATAGSPPQPPARAGAESRGATAPRDQIAGIAFDVEREADRLRARLVSAPGPTRSGRDPFRFGVVRPLATPSRPERARASALEPDLSREPLPTLAPAVKLIGLAERATPDGVVRSAVLSGPGDVFIVAVGDRLLDRYEVRAIGADAVELADAIAGTTHHLALR